MRRGKTMTVLALLAVIGAMTTLTAFAVPLYQAFCRITGYGGTTQVAERLPSRLIDRTITVRFNADVNPALPWRFQPPQDAIRVRLGEPALAVYTARSRAGVAITGTATFNVTPAKAGIYFNKIECFCFTEQTLNPGQRADLPVSFFIDPEMAADRNLDDVTTITLSYTFFKAKRQNQADGQRAALSAAPDRPRAN
jgi:cytochrome c oxidase assembly protein subunit 11